MSTIAVHGLGYVGVTAALAYAQGGNKVVGYDPNPEVVNAISHGYPQHGGAIKGIANDLVVQMGQGALTLTSSYADVLNSCADIHVIAVPTERDGQPWMELILKVVNYLLSVNIHTPVTILIESTLTPGTMDEMLLIAKRHHYAIGETLLLAACPRRDWFADQEKNVRTLVRVIGGVTPTCTAKALETVLSATQNVQTTGYREAELVKPAENALFHALVMAAYEIAGAYPHVDMNEVLYMAGTHWRLPELHYGLGTGGRCVPLGPKYIQEGTHRAVHLLEEGLDVDDNIRGWVAKLLCVAGGDVLNRELVILGAAYRADFKDAGLSPSITIAQRARYRHMSVKVHDPYFNKDELNGLLKFPGGLNWEDVEQALFNAHVILLAVAHEIYKTPPPVRFQEGTVILDAVGVWMPYRTELEAAGVKYVRQGEANWVAKLGGT